MDQKNGENLDEVCVYVCVRVYVMERFASLAQRCILFSVYLLDLGVPYFMIDIEARRII